MPTRNGWKALIDQHPESRLDPVGATLDMHRRSHIYKKMVEQRLLETGRPGTLRSMGGTGFSSVHEGVPFGRHGFHYWDEKALVHQSLQSFDGQQIEVMERLSFSPDRTTLICAIDISSSGRSVRHEDGFPISQASGQNWSGVSLKVIHFLGGLWSR